MSTPAVPNQTAHAEFVAKLNRFRGGLSTEEQGMLDALVGAARQVADQDDVGAYWFTGGLNGTTTQAPSTTTNIWTGYGDQGPWSNKPI